MADDINFIEEFLRLDRKGEQARINYCQYDRLFRSEFDPPYIPSQQSTNLAKEYNDLAQRSELPICGVIVGAIADQLRVDGITTDGEFDAELWDWWRSNGLYRRQSLVYRDSLVGSDGFLSITPDGDRPKFRPESPSLMSVEYMPDDPTIAKMATKHIVVQNHNSETHYGWLYTEDVIVALVKEPNSIGWKIKKITPHAAGQCPIVRFANRLDTAGNSESELKQVAPLQARINQTLFDRMLVQKSLSWHQRWISGVEIDYDDDGNPIPPFRVGVDQLAVAESPDARFGEWLASSIRDHLLAVEDDLRQAAAVTQTPLHLMAPAAVANVSAEALQAMNTGLVSKVMGRKDDWSDQWCLAMKIGGQMHNRIVPDSVQVEWANLESKSQSQIADAAVKYRSYGMPMSWIVKFMGLSPEDQKAVLEEIEEEEMKKAKAQADAFGIPSSQPTPQDTQDSEGSNDTAAG